LRQGMQVCVTFKATNINVIKRYGASDEN